MQQERGGSSSEDRKQPQDRRLLNPMQGGSENQQVLQQQQPQKCPRCESLNTKFCYYNNYSLSQPRYFCKTCRRYWTQGGTLRNVPVGGGCRKGKRTKISSPTDEPSSGPSKPRQPNIVSSTNLVLRSKERASPAPASSTAASTASYYPSGGFLSSLAAVHTQSFNPSQQLHQARNSANHIGGPSSLGLLEGFSAVVPSFGSSSSQQIEQSQIIYQMGDLREKSLNPTYHQNPPSDHHQESLIQSRRPGAGNASQPHEAWNIHQGFLNTDSNNLNNVPADDHHYTAVWSAITTNTNSHPAGSFNPNHQWPGYDPPL